MKKKFSLILASISLVSFALLSTGCTVQEDDPDTIVTPDSPDVKVTPPAGGKVEID
ncbi:MAG: hypothetical protein ACR2HJ_01490 [Fimbriimonadales bacterium]